MQSITAILLAGGQSRRMQYQNKSLALVLKKPLISYVLDRIEPQVEFILINANQNLQDYAKFHYPVVSDEFTGFLGPLAGIHAGLKASTTEWNLIVSCDTPNLPFDLVERFCRVSKWKQVVYAVCSSKKQPILMLINRTQIQKIELFLKQGQAKPIDFLDFIDAKPVDFSDQTECFMNLNTREELQVFEQSLMTSHSK